MRGTQEPEALERARAVQRVGEALDEVGSLEGLAPEAILERYRPLCLHIIEDLRVSLRLRRASHEDMLADAQVGLLEAARQFEHGHKARFSTYAYYRIKGNVVDGLRRAGVLRRPQRSRAALEQARAQVGEEQWTASPVQNDWRSRLSRLDSTISHHGVSWLLIQEAELRAEAQASARSPSRALLEAQTRQVLARCLESLSESERHVLEQYYLHKVPMDQLAQSYGYSRSWVSRVHTRALERLRRLMEGPLPRQPLPGHATKATVR